MMKSEEREFLKKQAEEETDSLRRADLFLKFSSRLLEDNDDEAQAAAEEALRIAENISGRRQIIEAEKLLSKIADKKADFRRALSHLSRAHEMLRDDSSGLTEYLLVGNLMAKMYANIGDYTRGLDFLFESLRLSENFDDKSVLMNTLNSMSVFYQRLDNTEKAEECARRCLAVAKQTDDTYITGISYVNLGIAFGMRKDWERAQEFWEIALSVFEKIGNVELQASVLGNLGIAYTESRKLVEAKQYLDRCLELKKKSGNLYDIARSMQNLSAVSIAMENFEDGLAYASEGLRLIEKLEARTIEYQLWREKAKSFKGLGRFEEALDAFEKYHLIEREIFSKEARTKTDLMLLRFDIEKSEQEKEIYRLRNIDLAEANAQITAGIRYAKRIQDALLPQGSALRHGFADAFVFYQPRDIVSGDFYWSLISDDAVLLAIADCTGHGVPGALMSVMGGAFLSEITNERGVSDPAEAMNLLRLKVITALHHHPEAADDDQLRDGMDIVLCRYEPATRNLRFACANNPLWILRGGKIMEFEADKFPVGAHHGQMTYFRSQEVQLEEGDQIFLFTDGFADQFGGEKGKKLGYKKLRELLISISSLDCSEQKSATEKYFQEWKGKNEQVDDVLLAGFRIK